MRRESAKAEFVDRGVGVDYIHFMLALDVSMCGDISWNLHHFEYGLDVKRMMSLE